MPLQTASLIRPLVFGAALGVVSLTLACGGGSGPGGGGAVTILGEKLTPRVIPDPTQGIPLGVVAVPETWKYDAKVVWNYRDISSPVSASSVAENPANEEAVFTFADAEFFDLRPRGGYIRVGQDSGGLIYGPPTPAVQTLTKFIRQLRGKEPQLTFVGSKDLPDLPAALKIPAAPNVQGVGIKVTYTLNGKPVEEEFYGVGYKIDIPFDGPQGRTWQINWGLVALHSFRAPAGTLDKRRPLFAAVPKSFRPNPAWQERHAAINKYLAAEFERQQKAGYDQIAAAGRLSKQISANNDAMIASIDQQLAASRTSSSSSGGSSASSSSNSAASFDDYIRGVHTVDDPYYGTSQHSSNSSFHWTDGYGNYRNSNDATYDPNRSEVGNWQAMKVIR